MKTEKYADVTARSIGDFKRGARKPKKKTKPVAATKSSLSWLKIHNRCTEHQLGIERFQDDIYGMLDKMAEGKTPAQVKQIEKLQNYCDDYLDHDIETLWSMESALHALNEAK